MPLQQAFRCPLCTSAQSVLEAGSTHNSNYRWLLDVIPDTITVATLRDVLMSSQLACSCNACGRDAEYVVRDDLWIDDMYSLHASIAACVDSLRESHAHSYVTQLASLLC